MVAFSGIKTFPLIISTIGAIIRDSVKIGEAVLTISIAVFSTHFSHLLTVISSIGADREDSANILANCLDAVYGSVRLILK